MSHVPLPTKQTLVLVGTWLLQYVNQRPSFRERYDMELFVHRLHAIIDDLPEAGTDIIEDLRPILSAREVVDRLDALGTVVMAAHFLEKVEAGQEITKLDVMDVRTAIKGLYRLKLSLTRKQINQESPQ